MLAAVKDKNVCAIFLAELLGQLPGVVDAFVHDLGQLDDDRVFLFVEPVDDLLDIGFVHRCAAGGAMAGTLPDVKKDAGAGVGDFGRVVVYDGAKLIGVDGAHFFGAVPIGIGPLFAINDRVIGL